MNTLNFNDADLKANREGQLSDAQAKRFDMEADRLQGQRKYSFWSGVTVFSLAVIGMILIACLMIGILIVKYASIDGERALPRLSATVSTFVFVMIIVFFVALLAFAIYMLDYYLRIRSLTSAPVRVSEGTAETHYSSLANSMEAITLGNRLVLHLTNGGSLTFEFDTVESLRHFKNGKYYRVYYLPYAIPQVLSAEEIEPEKAKR